MHSQPVMLLESARSLVAKLAALHAQLGEVSSSSQGQDDADDKGASDIVLPSSPIALLPADIRSRLDRYGVLQQTMPTNAI